MTALILTPRKSSKRKVCKALKNDGFFLQRFARECKQRKEIKRYHVYLNSFLQRTTHAAQPVAWQLPKVKLCKTGGQLVTFLMTFANAYPYMSLGDVVPCSCLVVSIFMLYVYSLHFRFKRWYNFDDMTDIFNWFGWEARNKMKASFLNVLGSQPALMLLRTRLIMSQPRHGGAPCSFPGWQIFAPKNRFIEIMDDTRFSLDMEGHKTSQNHRFFADDVPFFRMDVFRFHTFQWCLLYTHYFCCTVIKNRWQNIYMFHDDAHVRKKTLRFTILIQNAGSGSSPPECLLRIIAVDVSGKQP